MGTLPRPKWPWLMAWSFHRYRFVLIMAARDHKRSFATNELGKGTAANFKLLLRGWITTFSAGLARVKSAAMRHR